MKNVNNVTTKRYTMFIFIILAGILALAAGALLRPWFSEQSVEAARLSRPEEIKQSLIASTESVSTLIGEKISNDEFSVENPTVNASNTQMVNNISISIANFQRENERVNIDVCFDLPDNSDWTMWNGILEYGEKEYEWSETAPIEIRKPPIDGKQQVLTFPSGGGVAETWVDAGEGQMGIRCETISFEGIPVEPNLIHYTFTIDALEAAPNEGEACTQAYLEKVQTLLDAQKTGITVKCVEDEYASGIEVAGKPDSISVEAAQSLIYNSDFYLSLHGIKGPWIFEIEIQ